MAVMLLDPLVALREAPGAAVLPSARRRAHADSGGPPAEGPGDGGGGDDSWQPGGSADDDGERTSRAYFGLALALTGVTTLFCVLLAAFALLRSRAGSWRTEGAAEALGGLWLSSGILALSSLVLWAGQSALRRGHPRRLGRRAGWSTALGLAFLGAQVLSWRRLAAAELLPASGGYGTVFYALTAAHALHVVVGVGLLARLTLTAFRRPPPRLLSTTTTIAALYWHFLGLLWAVLFSLLVFVR